MTSSAAPSASSAGVGSPDDDPPSQRQLERGFSRATIDPLDRILSLGERATRVGMVVGILGTTLLHGTAGVKAARALLEMQEYATAIREHVKAELRAEYEIDANEPPPPPPPPPEPEPEPEPVQPKAVAAAAEAEPPPEPPPPAEAANLLTDPDAPLDLTGDGFVTGTGDRFAGGVTSSKGTSDKAVRNIAATPGGTGNPAATATKVSGAATAVDRSRPTTPAEMNWDCGFPKEADADGIDSAVVQVAVTVGTDGKARSAVVQKDPGSGFGRLAQRCALGKGYQAAWDKSGSPITSTRVFTIRFYR